MDQTTGTVRMKGSFPNADAQLWPGQFVNLRLYVDTLSHVVVVPTPAVQRGPDGPFVYRVEGGVAVMAKVQTGRQTEADTVVTAGLAPPAEVITTGFTRLTDGTKVAVSTATASAESAKPDAGTGPAAAEKDGADRAEADAAPDHAADARADAGGGRPRCRPPPPPQARRRPGRGNELMRRTPTLPPSPAGGRRCPCAAGADEGTHTALPSSTHPSRLRRATFSRPAGEGRPKP